MYTVEKKLNQAGVDIFRDRGSFARYQFVAVFGTYSEALDYIEAQTDKVKYNYSISMGG